MHNAETVSRAIQVLNLDVCYWRAGCGDKPHVRFGGGPTEKCSGQPG